MPPLIHTRERGETLGREKRNGGRRDVPADTPAEAPRLGTDSGAPLYGSLTVVKGRHVR